MPGKFAECEPISIRREQRELIAVDLHLHPSEERQGFISACCHRDLCDSPGEVLNLDRARVLRHFWEVRVVLDLHRPQGESRRTTGDVALPDVIGEFHWTVGERLR